MKEKNRGYSIINFRLLDMEDKYPVPVKYSLTSWAIGWFLQAVCMYSDRDTVTSLNVFKSCESGHGLNFPVLSLPVVYEN